MRSAAPVNARTVVWAAHALTSHGSDLTSARSRQSSGMFQSSGVLSERGDWCVFGGSLRHVSSNGAAEDIGPIRSMNGLRQSRVRLAVLSAELLEIMHRTPWVIGRWVSKRPYRLLSTELATIEMKTPVRSGGWQPRRRKAESGKDWLTSAALTHLQSPHVRKANDRAIRCASLLPMTRHRCMLKLRPPQ
jgi:hypothetical protein